MEEKILQLKNDIKKAFKWDDGRLEQFWITPNPLLNDKAPKDMTYNDYDFSRLSTLIKFSTIEPKTRRY